MTTRRRPTPEEHDPYYSVYIDRVPDGDVIEILRAQMEATQDLLAGVDLRLAYALSGLGALAGLVVALRFQEPPRTGPPAAAPVSGLRLLFRAIAAMIGGWFGKRDSISNTGKDQ